MEVSVTNITSFSVYSSSLIGSQNVFLVELGPNNFPPSLLIGPLDVAKLLVTSVCLIAINLKFTTYVPHGNEGICI